MTNSASQKQWVDLHLHTSMSDGTLSPSELARLAVASGVRVVSVTDHDTVSGIEEARTEAEKLGIKFVPGIEISARCKRGILHILGYGINYRSPELLSKLKEFQDIRRNRNEKIIQKLIDLGVDISLEEVEAEAQNVKSAGRPHIAVALMKKGVVSDVNQAFEEYLGRNKKTYVKKDIFSARESIDIVRRAGGKAFLAHPVTLNLKGSDFEEYLLKLKDSGLEGVEVYSPIHSVEETEIFRKTAEKMKLLISAGSDFHGELKSHIKLGHCYNGRKIEKGLISEELLAPA